MFEFYYTHNNTEYKVFPLDVTDGVGWKNIHGAPCNAISLVGIRQGYLNPKPDRYRINYDNGYFNNVSYYNDEIERRCLSLPNRSMEQRQECKLVRGYAAVECNVICSNPDFMFAGATDMLEGNSNTGIISGLGINLNEFPHEQDAFDIFYGGFYLANEGRYLIPLDFGNILQGGRGDIVPFEIKAVSNMTNCYARIINKAVLQQNYLGWWAAPIYYMYQQNYNPSYTGGIVEISFANLRYGNMIIDMLMDGVGYDMVEVATGTVMTNGEGLVTDDTTEYMFAEGTPYQGITVVLANGTDNNSTALLFVSPGSNVWDMMVGGMRFSGGNSAGFGNMNNQDYMDISLQCVSPSGMNATSAEGLLVITADQGELMVPLTVNIYPVDSINDGETATDGDLFLRCAVLTANNFNKLAEFGVTEAS